MNTSHSTINEARYRLPFFAVLLSLPLLAVSVGTVSGRDEPSAKSASKTEKKAVAEGETKRGERLISIVLLLREPRKLDHKQIAHAVSEGAGVKVSEEDVISKPPYHLVKLSSDKFIVNNISEPYFEEVDDLASEIKDGDLSNAIKDSKAWISVDWVGKNAKADLKHIYQHIGKMAAHLSEKDVLAVYSPDMDEFAIWNKTTRKGLESDDPLAVFESAEVRK